MPFRSVVSLPATRGCTEPFVLMCSADSLALSSALLFLDGVRLLFEEDLALSLLDAAFSSSSDTSGTGDTEIPRFRLLLLFLDPESILRTKIGSGFPI